MKISVKVSICDNQFLLRTIEQEDSEILRLWKNEHKEFFFYKKEISQEEQKLWISALGERLHDHMFLVTQEQNRIGCIGARLLEEYVDVYNVILGDKDYKGKHVMKNALWAVVSLSNLIYNSKPVRVSVLKNNPAIKWYDKIGFYSIKDNEDHIVMQFNNQSTLTQYDFKINITLPIF